MSECVPVVVMIQAFGLRVCLRMSHTEAGFHHKAVVASHLGRLVPRFDSKFQTYCLTDYLSLRGWTGLPVRSSNTSVV